MYLTNSNTTSVTKTSLNTIRRRGVLSKTCGSLKGLWLPWSSVWTGSLSAYETLERIVDSSFLPTPLQGLASQSHVMGEKCWTNSGLSLLMSCSQFQTLLTSLPAMATLPHRSFRRCSSTIARTSSRSSPISTPPCLMPSQSLMTTWSFILICTLIVTPPSVIYSESQSKPTAPRESARACPGLGEPSRAW